MKKTLIVVVFLSLVSFPWAQNQKHFSSVTIVEKNNHPEQKDWNGTWQTNWGEMVLTVKGNVVEGYYEHDSGKIKGVLTDNGKVIKGRWSESPSYEMPNDAGEIEFTLASDDSFTGKWKYGTSGSWSTWTGTRKK